MSLEERMDAYFEGNIKKFNAITARAINEINAHIEQGNFKSARICCEHEINVMRELIDERMEQEVLEHYRAHLNKIEKLRNEIIAQRSNNNSTKPQAKNNTNMTKDINELKKLAEQGDAEAQYKLGDCYSIGEGVEEDPKLTMYWYRKSAEQGYAKAQASLGACYLTGEDGYTQDLEQAEYWIKKSVAQGEAFGTACWGLYYSVLLAEDEDNEEYIEQVFALFTEAAEQGDAFGQAMLGTIYEGAEEVDVAVYWYKKAEEQGDSIAIKLIKENSKIYKPKSKPTKNDSPKMTNNNAPNKKITTMFCYSCGVKLQENAKFCAGCGTKVVQPDSIQESEDNNNDEFESGDESLNLYIKCKKCEKVLYVEFDSAEEALSTVSMRYECNDCGEDIEVSFFGFCRNCEENVGFKFKESKDLLIDVAQSVVQGFFRPVKAITNLKRYADNIPSSEHSGICPFCGQPHIRCCECSVSIVTQENDDVNNVYSCTGCRSRMRA